MLCIVTCLLYDIMQQVYMSWLYCQNYWPTVGNLRSGLCYHNVCPSVCPSVTRARCGQKPEPIELIFGMVVTLGPLDNVLDGGLRPPILGGLMGGGIFFTMGKIGKQGFNVRYLGYDERYEVGLNGGRIGSRLWAIDWTH